MKKLQNRSTESSIVNRRRLEPAQRTITQRRMKEISKSKPRSFTMRKVRRRAMTGNLERKIREEQNNKRLRQKLIHSKKI
jgi:hypothetical protein